MLAALLLKGHLAENQKRTQGCHKLEQPTGGEFRVYRASIRNIDLL